MDKKEAFKGFKELKKIAAERILRILSNRLFIDIRKVRRFRIWQSEYLHHVMQGISIKNSEKQTNLKLKYLQFMNLTLLKYLRKGFYLWVLCAKSRKLNSLPNTLFFASIKLVSILLKNKLDTLGYKNFSFNRSNAWKNSRMKVALFTWKKLVISSLLSESHKEMAAVRIVHFLHKKTTPFINFAVKKICFRAGSKLPALSLGIVLKKLVYHQKHFGLMKVCRKESGSTPNPTNIREQRSKFSSLQKFAALKQLSAIMHKRKIVNKRLLDLSKAVFKWKNIRNKVKRRQSKRVKGTNRQIKLVGARFLLVKLKEVLNRRVLSMMSRWKFRPLPEFDIDKNVIFNQAQVAAYIESQILKKVTEIKKVKKSTLISNLVLCVIKRLKRSFCTWTEICVKEENSTNDRDIVYEYIRYLEDNLGVPHKFRH